MAEHVRGGLTGEADTSALFEKYTIAEIREIEKKTRQDIERKKEDLRQMVGERYRDLIEAADTITDMKQSADNVMSTIARMQDLCQRMKDTYQNNLTASSPQARTKRQKAGNQFYSVAVQIKLLLDMPEKIWSAVELSQYLLACQLYLLARHVHTGLQLDAQLAARIQQWFPLLTRQWAAISHFKTTLLQVCRDTLKRAEVSDQITAECLCAVMLLEDSTPRQVFNDFLLARTSAVQQLFQTDQGDTTIKAQIREVVRVIVSTVHQIYTIFYQHKDKVQNAEVPSNLLIFTLDEVTDKGEPGVIMTDLQPTSVRYLPRIVREFRPALRLRATPLSPDDLLRNSQQWIQSCSSDVQNGLNQLLAFINSLKQLAAIKNEVWTLLKEDRRMATWSDVCTNVLGRQVSVWQEFLQPVFMARVKELLQLQFDVALDTCKQQVAVVLTDIGNSTDRTTQAERNIASYIWKEHPQDLPSNMAWVTVTNKSLADCGTLMMKVRAYSPAVQSLCQNFDHKLKLLLEDANFYMQALPDGAPSEPTPFKTDDDMAAIQLYILAVCDQCISGLVEHLQQHLYAGRQQLKNSGDAQGNALIVDRMLLLGRLSGAIGELSSHLHQCMMGSVDKADASRLLRKSPSYARGVSKTADNPEWAQLQEKLLKFSAKAYSVWAEHISKQLVEQFSKTLLDNSGQNILMSSTRWNDIEIEEETEEGKTMKSTIRVPMQASWYVHSMLYSLCAEINRVGGHALHRSTLVGLVQHTSDGVLAAFEQFLMHHKNSGKGNMNDAGLPLTQTRALQLLFDIKFLINTLPRKDDSKESKKYQSRIQKVAEQLESHIDPFDLDVFLPYIQTHLSRQTQCCSVLYGAVMSLDKHAMYSSTRPPTSQQGEQHNVLPLSSVQGRFSLLPLSVQNRAALGQPIVQPPKPKPHPLPTHQGTVSGPGSPPPTVPSPQEAQSFLGQMSTLWFSNVGAGSK